MSIRRLTVALTFTVFVTPAAAFEVFKWLDDDGVMHFSEQPPGDATSEVTRLELSISNPPDYDPQTDEYSIRNQAARTSEVYQKVEKRRAAREAERAEIAEREAQASMQRTAYYHYPVPRYFIPIQRPWRPLKPVHYHRQPKTARPNRQHSRIHEGHHRAPARREAPPRQPVRQQYVATAGARSTNWAPSRKPH